MSPSETYRKINPEFDGYYNNAFINTEPPVIPMSSLEEIMDPKKPDNIIDTPEIFSKHKIKKNALDP